VIFATLSTLWCPFESPFWNTCINPTSRRPSRKRTAPLATVAINANRRERLIRWNCFRWIAQYSNVVVAGTRYICTLISLFATTLYYGGAKFEIGLYFVHHCLNRNHNIITAEMLTFMDENVHRSTYAVSLNKCGWYNDLAFLTAVWQYLTVRLQWSSKISWQRHNERRQWRYSSLTSIFIDAQLRRTAVHIHAQFWRFWGNVWSRKLSVVGHLADPIKGTSLRDCT